MAKYTWHPKRRSEHRFTDRQRAAYWKKKYLTCKRSVDRFKKEMGY